jgi:hypothetical protein
MVTFATHDSVIVRTSIYLENNLFTQFLTFCDDVHNTGIDINKTLYYLIFSTTLKTQPFKPPPPQHGFLAFEVSNPPTPPTAYFAYCY